MNLMRPSPPAANCLRAELSIYRAGEMAWGEWYTHTPTPHTPTHHAYPHTAISVGNQCMYVSIHSPLPKSNGSLHSVMADGTSFSDYNHILTYCHIWQ